MVKPGIHLTLVYIINYNTISITARKFKHQRISGKYFIHLSLLNTLDATSLFLLQEHIYF